MQFKTDFLAAISWVGTRAVEQQPNASMQMRCSVIALMIVLMCGTVVEGQFRLSVSRGTPITAEPAYLSPPAVGFTGIGKVALNFKFQANRCGESTEVGNVDALSQPRAALPRKAEFNRLLRRVLFVVSHVFHIRWRGNVVTE